MTPSLRQPIRALIFDLGDVLFTWSASSTTSALSEKQLRSILASKTWDEFDRGSITQAQCYQRAAEEHSITLTDIQTSFDLARESIFPNQPLIAAIQAFRASCRDTVKIFAMSNISKEDYDYLSPQVSSWNIFDQVFTSGHVGSRKPEAAFYRHVLREAKIDHPSDAVFVDDKVENVFAAQALGMRGFIFNEKGVIDLLKLIGEDPVERGYRYLLRGGEGLESITDTGVVVRENFAKLLIQDVLPSLRLIQPRWEEKPTWNFFDGDPVLIPGKTFPDDLDTTSLALCVVPPKQEGKVADLLDGLLEYAQSDGNFQTYFDWSKRRTDVVVSANVLACFFLHGRGHELPNTLNLVREVLLSRKYINGTHYYSNADCCLYFFGRLLHVSDDCKLHAVLGSLLKDRTEERVGQPGSALELAMRIITCHQFQIPCSTDVSTLLSMQQDDGGWPIGWIYQYGSTKVQLGNRGVTTAMAIKALSIV